MAKQEPGKSNSLRTSVKGPLVFSAFFAALTFVTVLIFASGGSAKSPRFDLAFTGAGIAFIVTLVIAAMLSMSYKENEPHLGKGSGVNLSSAKRPGPGRAGGHAGSAPAPDPSQGDQGDQGDQGAPRA